MTARWHSGRSPDNSTAKSVNLLAVRATGSHLTLGARLLLVIAVLFTEKFLLNFFVDFEAAQRASGLGALVRDVQHFGFRFVVTLIICLALLSYMRSSELLLKLNAAARGAAVRGRWLLVHGLLVTLLGVLSYNLYAPGTIPFAARVALWMACALGGIVALLAALAPWQLWGRMARVLGVLWLYAAAAAAVAACAMPLSQALWQHASRVTFTLTGALLAPLVPTFHADPATQVLSAGNFAVQISEVCSGLEGAGLMLAFCGAWLLYFRRDYYFPQALILIPIALLLVLALNVVRIAVLILIGYGGLPEVAVYGFHSQAGWIAFNAAAAAVVLTSQRSSSLSRVAARTDAGHANPATPYLLPLLAILATGMVTIAISSGFDVLYGLRLVAGLVALRYSLPRLAAINWRLSWRGPTAGVAAFLLWILVARALFEPTPIPATLAAMPPWLRDGWIMVRAVAAVCTVPIAEELAYRGYLMRRLMAAEFETVAFNAVRPWAILVSAIAFGVLHGVMWPAGIATGAIYAWLAVRTGRIGETVAAHVTTNALLCAYVLLGGWWQLW